ncbi:hypothetical protein [Streptomyces sp. NPDC048111]|uniref:hypothetical protein n=1 Tax=Streptomyces sp. NPDC048111 TaxID=3365500 RepID=UPI003717E70B
MSLFVRPGTGAFPKRRAAVVTSIAAAAVFSAAAVAHAGAAQPHSTTSPVQARAASSPTAQYTVEALSAAPSGDAGFSAAELQQAKAMADGIAQLGVTEDQFAAALDISLTRTVDLNSLRGRLGALPASPTAQQTAAAVYPGDAAAQAAMLPVLANEKVRSSTLRNLAGQSGERAPAVAFGWWDQTKFYVGCGAAVASVLISFVPAGAGVKVARAVKLFKSYGAKKTAEILWRFLKTKHVGSKEREAVKAFIGISAIQKACT